VTEQSIIFDADAVRALLAGRKTQTRRLASSPLRGCRPGDQLWVKEICVGAKRTGTGNGEAAAALRDADIVVLRDGWRQDRNGSGRKGAAPTNPRLIWMPAVHMPRWASRATIVVESVRTERLRDISRADAIAESQLRPLARFFIGLRDPRPAFAARWNRIHGTPGERWEDDPEVVVLGFRLVN
jgi:hypothetical protein